MTRGAYGLVLFERAWHDAGGLAFRLRSCPRDAWGPGCIHGQELSFGPGGALRGVCREEPQIQYQERIVEVPQVQVQERIVHVPRVEIQERVVQVPKIEYVERIVEVPQIQYQERLLAPRGRAGLGICDGGATAGHRLHEPCS